jgi:hypothetical protein
MCLIWLDRVVSDRSRRRTPSADAAAYAFSTKFAAPESVSDAKWPLPEAEALAMHRCLFFATPKIGATQRKRVFGATHATTHIELGSAPGAISYSVNPLFLHSSRRTPLFRL